MFLSDELHLPFKSVPGESFLFTLGLIKNFFQIVLDYKNQVSMILTKLVIIS